jgi:hypothetical protein
MRTVHILYENWKVICEEKMLIFIRIEPITLIFIFYYLHFSFCYIFWLLLCHHQGDKYKGIYIYMHVYVCVCVYEYKFDIYVCTHILYIKLNVCVCVCVCTLYKFTFLNQSEPNCEHIPPLVSKRPTVCMDPQFLTFVTFFRRFPGSELIIRVTVWRRWSIARQRNIRDCEL